MTTTELSTEVITHRLKIKGEGTKYISKKMAETIFSQLYDESKKTITIINSRNLTYITKYRSEVELIPLDLENKDSEDKMHLNGLNNDQKEKMRNIIIQRKKDNKRMNENVFNELLQAIKNGEL